MAGPQLPRRAWWVGLAAAALLAAHAALAVTSLWIKSVTFDEVSHLPAGLAAVRTGELRLNRQHPPLVKLLAGLAASPAAPDLALGSDAYRAADEWRYGREVLFRRGNDHWAMLRRGRLPTVLLSLLGGLAVFLWVREGAGGVPGDGAAGAGAAPAALFALALWCFSPSILAHARWVTMDLPLAAFSTWALYLGWRLDRRPSAPRGAACGVALGCAFATKASAVLLPPLLLAAACLTRRRPERPDAPTWRRRAAMGSVAAVVAAGVVWAAYGFPADLLGAIRPLFATLSDLPAGYRFYLAGSFSPRGFAAYFPVAFLLKSTPVELLAAVAAPVAWLWRRGLRRGGDLFVALPAAGLFLATSAWAWNRGHRYLLSVYPLLFVAAGLLAARLAPLLRRRMLALLLLLASVGQAASALRAYPDYLPYFNLFAGGRDRGPYWLDDSNVDWGQDVARAPRWLAAHGIRGRVRAVFIGWTDAGFYGVDWEPPRVSDLAEAPRPGAYLLSAHTLVRGLLHHRERGWSSDWLDRYRPVDVLGGSLWLYVFPPAGSVEGGSRGGSDGGPATLPR